MMGRMFYSGGRWFEAPVCWLKGIYDTVRLGTFVMGARVCGHRWTETQDSKWPGQHLVCNQCGREAVEVNDAQ
jgi:hypothetical protein